MEKRTRWVIGLGVCGLVLFGPGLVWLVRLQVQQWQLDRELAQLKAKHEQLAREETRLRSDPVYVEGLIRSTFKYAKPGELVVPLESERTDGKAR